MPNWWRLIRPGPRPWAGWRRSWSANSALDLIHPDDHKATLAEMGGLAAELPPRRFGNRYRHRDGSWHWFAWTALLDEGLVYATGHNVTSERAASDALGVAEKQLHRSQKMEGLRQLNCVRMAHDLNNAFQGIGSNLELLQLRIEQGRPTDATRYIETMYKGLDHAAALTARLLAFARR